MITQSALISKIEKANRYVQEKDRLTFTEFKVDFQGEHDIYQVVYEQKKWHCSCHFFSQHDVCSHTMAVQKILSEMLPSEALTDPII